MAKKKRGPNDPTIVKKYANRRLYDTGRSSYVTLDDLCEMVKEGHDFVVQDAKTGKDITRSVLTQIIVDQEANGENLLPTGFLKSLIGFYGDSVQGFVPQYLETTFDAFVKNQEELRNQMMQNMNNMSGMMPGTTSLEEMNRQNMEMFERTMKMFSPFGMGFAANEGSSNEEKNSK